MGALLTMVPPSGKDMHPAVDAVADMAMSVQRTCRVLSAVVLQRLNAMNSASRELRAMGYRVVSETLYPPRGGRPLLVIDRGVTTKIGPLLARSCGLTREQDGDKRRASTSFMGVTVSWEEA